MKKLKIEQLKAGIENKFYFGYAPLPVLCTGAIIPIFVFMKIHLGL
jgi:hypothetical protein